MVECYESLAMNKTQKRIQQEVKAVADMVFTSSRLTAWQIGSRYMIATDEAATRFGRDRGRRAIEQGLITGYKQHGVLFFCSWDYWNRITERAFDNSHLLPGGAKRL